MSHRRPPPPFYQGALDALCGPYCLVNVVRYLRPQFSSTEGVRLLKRILRVLERERPLVKRITYGTVHQELVWVLKEVLGPRYGIRWSLPFKGRRGLTWEAYVDEVATFFDQTHGIALISLGGIHDHWTLVRRVTAKSLLLYDSDQLSRLSLKTCALKPAEDRRRWHVIQASKTLFLWVE